MLSISKMVSEDYYSSLAAEDYYLNGGEPPGRWAGSGASHFGLSGTVDKADFSALYRGVHPHTGGKLIGSSGKQNHVAGWDFTFSAPKSVSVVWSRARLETSQFIQRLQQEAVEETIAFAEEHFAFTRTGHAGSGEQLKARLTVATYEHGTSRALDPQLHTHALFFNVGVAEDGTTRSVHSPLLFQAKMVMGAYYRAALANKLEKQLGLRTRKHGHSFEVVGVPQEVIDDCSKRRKEILKRLHELALSGAKAASVVALDTRTKKEIPPRKQLYEQWQTRYDEMGFTEQQLAKLSTNNVRDNRRFISQALEEATKTITLNKPFFRAKDFLFEALCAAVEFGIAPEDMLQPVNEYMGTTENIVPMPQQHGETIYTTPLTLLAERELLRTTCKMLRRHGAKVADTTVRNTLKKHNSLIDEQRAAYRHLLQSKSSLRFLHGMAGTGKTSYVLKACIDAWKKAGYNVIGAAPTGKAAEVLQDEAGIPCDTIHYTLADFEIDSGFDWKHHLKQLTRAAQGKKTFARSKPKPIPVDKNTVLVVDEAGMVNTRHFQMLMDHVRKGGGTLVFIGDPYQLPPVEGSAPFLSLSRRVGYQQLTDIKRQKEIWARVASRLFAMGEAGQALAMYAERDLIKTFNDTTEALEGLIDDWCKIGLTTPAKAAILTHTNDDCDEANRVCQQRRILNGYLNRDKGPSATATDTREEGNHQSQLYKGDRVLFTHGDRPLGVKNGSLGTVVDVNPRNNSITVQLDVRQKIVRIPLNKFPHVRLGYAMTNYRAQGTTLKEAFLLVGGFMQDLPTTYVQATRASGTTRFYTTKELLNDLKDVEASVLAEQMGRRPDLRLASELIQTPYFASTNRQKVFRTLLNDWLPEYQAAPHRTIILTDNQEQAAEFNKHCHELLKSQVPTEELPTLTTPTGVELIPGTKIRFDRMLFSQSIAKGDVATVTRVYVDQGVVELLDKRLNQHRTILAEELKDVQHAYANQIRDHQKLRDIQRQREEEQKPAFRYTEDEEVRRQQNYQDNLNPQPITPLWAQQAYQINQPTPVIPQQQYACLGGPAMQMQQKYVQEINAMQQRIEEQSHALTQSTQVQKNSWYEYAQHYQQSQAHTL